MAKSLQKKILKKASYGYPPTHKKAFDNFETSPTSGQGYPNLMGNNRLVLQID